MRVECACGHQPSKHTDGGDGWCQAEGCNCDNFTTVQEPEGWTPCDTGDCVRKPGHDGLCSLGAECSICEAFLRPEHMANHEVRHRFMGEGKPTWFEPGTSEPYCNRGEPQ